MARPILKVDNHRLYVNNKSVERKELALMTRLIGILLMLLCGCASTHPSGVDFPWADTVIRTHPEPLEWTDLVPKKKESFDLEKCPFDLTPEEKWGKLLPPPKDAHVMTADANQ